MKHALILAALVAATPLAAQAQQQPAPAPADPARAAVATRVANRLLPNGALANMMQASMETVTGSMTDQMMQLPLRDLMRGSGIGADEAEKMGPATLKEIMSLVDPVYQERNRIMMKVIADEMIVIMGSMEPEYRAGMADALAARFTLEQLNELDRFFATPTGNAYAGQSLGLYADPAMMRRMQAMMPKIMQAMPAIMEKVSKATAGLPAMRKFSDLTPQERKRMDALLSPEKEDSE